MFINLLNYRKLLFCGLICVSTGVFAQADEENYDSKLSDDLILSPRASGMSGAVSTSAENADAFYYNPAGLGGLNSKNYRSFVRRFDFLSLSGAINENTGDLNDDMMEAGGGSNSAAAATVMDAAAGKRQYGRFSVFPNFVLGRFFIGGIHDTQLASVALEDQPGMVNLNYKTINGQLLGFSAASADDTFYIGFSGAILERQDISGDFQFLDMIDAETRDEVFKTQEKNYSGLNKNAGIIWRISKKAGTPTLGISVRDLGSTEYTAKESSYDNIIVKENMTIGFSVTPSLSKWSQYHFAIEGQNLTNKDQSINNKFSVANELRFGSYTGQKSFLAMRAGYKTSGHSYGLSLNFGIIEFHVSSEAVNIVENNTDTIERRNSAQLTVNLAE